MFLMFQNTIYLEPIYNDFGCNQSDVFVVIVGAFRVLLMILLLIIMFKYQLLI